MSFVEVVTSFWLMPILFLFFIPLFLAIAALFQRSSKPVDFKEEISDEEKREYPRFPTSRETVAKITVGNMLCTGLVCNISKTGVSLKNLPKMISNEIDKLSVVISQYGVDYNLLLKPKWVELTESGKWIGAEVDSPSSDWSKFIRQTEEMGREKPVR
jgi:hypothetical protein